MTEPESALKFAVGTFTISQPETNRHGRTGNKKAGPQSTGASGFSCPEGRYRWWRWAELNRRPKALHPQHYMLSSPLNLIPEQHGVQSAPGNQPVLF